MPSIQRVIFVEPFFGYRMNADGTHNGVSNPIRDSDKLQLWIRNWIETQHELRVIDAGDSIVMQIVQGRMIYPPASEGRGALIWDKEKKNWAVETAPPISAELQALFDAARDAKDSVGRFVHCIECKQPFSLQNTHSSAGWRETQISGYCENCFDKIFAGDEDEDEDEV
jgi:hypothetical protein